jgi:hypothetical protein
VNTLSFSKFALGFLAVASLAACGGSQPPVSAGPTSPFGAAAPPASGKRSALLYVTEPRVNRAAIYAYPSLKYETELSRLRSAAAICSDPRTGNVWVINGIIAGGNRLSEFANGSTKPIRTIRTSEPELQACAVNPKNGDLAVPQATDYDDPGGLFVFKKASGTPTLYQDKKMYMYYFAGYDTSGNVFVDGYDYNGNFRLDVLPGGSTRLIDATPSGQKITVPGGVQYDGTYVTVADQHGGLIYRIAYNTVIGRTQLTDTCVMQQYVFDGDSVIVPSSCGKKGSVLVYNYPAGGTPTREIDVIHAPYGVAVSK